MNIRTSFQALLDSDRGASMVEYALLVMLIAMIAFLAVQVLGGEVSSSFSEVADGFPS
ncbi:hypothetical protein BH23ACT5_BH23ACT5_22200 [soil metagenome]